MKLITDDQVAPTETRWQPGDVVAFWGRHWKSRVIELVTAGPSHVGIIANYGGRPTLFESTTLCDLECVVRGRTIKGVQAHYVMDRVRTYDGVIRRVPIAPSWRLDSDDSAMLTSILCNNWIGQPYNLRGALLCWTRVIKWTRLMPYPDQGSQFCSELVSAMLMRFGRCELENPSRFNPASLIRRLQECGTHLAPEPIRGTSACFATAMSSRS